MRRGTLYYLMVPLMAVAALLQSTAFNRLAIAGVKPDLVLLLVVVGTLLYGPRAGVVWAFIGGLFLDIFSGGPLGSSSLALMAAAVVAGFGHTTMSRFNIFVPLGAMALGTLTYGLVYAGTLLDIERRGRSGRSRCAAPPASVLGDGSAGNSAVDRLQYGADAVVDSGSESDSGDTGSSFCVTVDGSRRPLLLCMT